MNQSDSIRTRPGQKSIQHIITGFQKNLLKLLPGYRRMLDWVQVEVTSRCHGSCNYCPFTVFRNCWRGRDMQIGTFQRLWPLLMRAERVHLQGWGEPLLHPDFFAFAALARKAGCAVSTTTCGLGLTKAQAAYLVDRELDLVAFSLTGTDSLSNAARAGISFEAVCRSVECLQSIRRARGAAHMEIHFAYLLLASNMEAVAKLPDLMRRLGVHAAVVSTLDFVADPSLKAEAFLPVEKDELAAAGTILAETASGARRLGLGFDYTLPQWDRPRAGCRENIGRSLYVSAEGDLSPCVYLNIPADGLRGRRRIFGNVNVTDPLSIWESHFFRDFRENLMRAEPDPICRSCPKRFML